MDYDCRRAITDGLEYKLDDNGDLMAVPSGYKIQYGFLYKGKLGTSLPSGQPPNQDAQCIRVNGKVVASFYLIVDGTKI